jgi:hypothetical protein
MKPFLLACLFPLALAACNPLTKLEDEAPAPQKKATASTPTPTPVAKSGAWMQKKNIGHRLDGGNEKLGLKGDRLDGDKLSVKGDRLDEPPGK